MFEISANNNSKYVYFARKFKNSAQLYGQGGIQTLEFLTIDHDEEQLRRRYG